MEKSKVKYTLTHSEALRKARTMAETARPAITDHEFWNNDYTDDMIAIIRDPSFMSKSTFFASALTDEDREFLAQHLLRAREVDNDDRAARDRLRRQAEIANQLIAAEAMGLTPAEARALMF